MKEVVVVTCFIKKETGNVPGLFFNKANLFLLKNLLK